MKFVPCFIVQRTWCLLQGFCRVAGIVGLCFIVIFQLLTGLSSARTVVDQVGRRVEVPEHPQKIISLMPSITEIIFELGQEKKLKGVTLFSRNPPAASRLPRVGSYVHLDLEKIVSLKPDLCLALRDGNPRYMVDKIEQLAIPVYVIDPRDMDGIIDCIIRLGSLVGAESQAAEIVLKMRQKIMAGHAIVSQAKYRPRVFFQIDASPIISAGSNTFIQQLITMAGGENLAAGSTAYPRYSWEDILEMRPEIVLIASMAGGQSEDELKAGWLRWPRIPAVRDKRIYVVDADLFDRPTPRLLDGLQTLLRLIHPELGQP